MSAKKLATAMENGEYDFDGTKDKLASILSTVIDHVLLQPTYKVVLLKLYIVTHMENLIPLLWDQTTMFG